MSKPPVVTVQEIVNQCRPIFRGRGPAAQGCALADLVAIWLAGFDDPNIRRQARAEFDAMVDELISIAAGTDAAPPKGAP